VRTFKVRSVGSRSADLQGPLRRCSQDLKVLTYFRLKHVLDRYVNAVTFMMSALPFGPALDGAAVSGPAASTVCPTCGANVLSSPSST